MVGSCPLKPWGPGRESPLTWPCLAVGDPHLVSLRLIRVHCLGAKLTVSPGDGCFSRRSPQGPVCIPFNTWTTCFPFPGVRKLPLSQSFISPISLTRAPDSTQTPPLHHFPASPPFCLHREGPFLKAVFQSPSHSKHNATTATTDNT